VEIRLKRFQLNVHSGKCTRSIFNTLTGPLHWITPSQSSLASWWKFENNFSVWKWIIKIYLPAAALLLHHLSLL